MKTLSEEVKDIVTSSATKSAKAMALKKLCITPYEIEILLSEPAVSMHKTITRYTFTFGVEIECGVNRDRFVNAAASTGMAYEYQSYNHRDGHNFFKFVTDGSLRLPDAIECVSPVLRGNAGKNALKNACKTLNQAGASVNRTCGLHVHIGARNITEKQFVNTFVNYLHLESLIDSFMAYSRRYNNNDFSNSLKDHADALGRCHTIRHIQDALHYSRYHKVNPMSWDRHKTIEFRQHQGSTDYEKIINWVQFCGKLVVWSKNNRLTEDVRSIDDIPFLSETEKTFFKGRIERLSGR